MNYSLKTKDYFLSQEQFELRYDDSLDMLVTHPKPREISKYYESENYISHTDGTETKTHKLYQFAKRINLRNKLSLITKFHSGTETLFDVGAGTGEFLFYVKNRGWTTYGVEPNAKANQLAKEKGLELKLNIDEYQNTQFGVITLWHVLEHLPDLKKNIKQLSKMLEDNGTLCIAVPNFKSFDAKYYQKFWAAYDVPRHLWHFSKSSIQNLFGRHGLELVCVKPMWFDSFYVSLLSEEYKTGKKNWIKAFLIGFISNAKGIFTKEFSSHIYILKKTNRST